MDIPAGDFGFSISHRRDSAKPQRKPSNEPALRETRVVGCLRLTLASLLVVVAFAISFAAHSTGMAQEIRAFERDFLNIAHKFISAFEASARQQLAIIESFSMDLTAYAKNHKDFDWPFVFLPDFEIRAGYNAEQAGLVSMGVLIHVTDEDRTDFLPFMANDITQEQGIALQRGVAIGDVEPVPRLPDVMVRTSAGYVVDNSTGPYLISNQVYPARPVPWRGQNFLADPAVGPTLEWVLESKTMTMGSSFEFIDEVSRRGPKYETIQHNLDATKFGSLDGLTYQNDPMAAVFYPVFDEFSTKSDRRIVAVILGGVYWRTLFANVLPKETNVITVLTNSCGQAYTYEIDGGTSRFIGFGDMHDSKYDHLKVSPGYYSHWGLKTDDSSHGCSYSVLVYPSHKLEDSYLTSSPITRAITLAAVLVFTSLIFIFYDRVVQRRQKIVLRAALRSGAIVSSLFPEEYHQRLYEEQDQPPKSTEDDTPEVGNATIAALHKNCSVIFMDIAGFTSFSSNRTPTEVFDLLETTYAVFDKEAAKRKVFKVETIGDCYVAACGLPREQPDHALVMAQFATECLRQFQHVTSGELAHRLGDDCHKLQLRVGIHSGPVTAGVLRGDKSRFQIFGDTVNTASRMETTGIPGQIHLSASTAAILTQFGKECWVEPRAELVNAKGKGSLQTYWLKNIEGSCMASEVHT